MERMKSLLPILLLWGAAPMPLYLWALIAALI